MLYLQGLQPSRTGPCSAARRFFCSFSEEMGGMSWGDHSIFHRIHVGLIWDLYRIFMG